MKSKNKVLIIMICILVVIALSSTIVYAPKPTPNPTPQLVMTENGSIEVPPIGPEQEYTFEISTEGYRHITLYFSSIEATIVGPESGFGVIIDNKLDVSSITFTAFIDELRWSSNPTFYETYDIESPQLSFTVFNLSPTETVSDVNIGYYLTT